MSPLMTFLVANAAIVLKTSTAVAASAVALAASAAHRKASDANQIELARHTLSDIGVEPGSLTWIR